MGHALKHRWLGVLDGRVKLQPCFGSVARELTKTALQRAMLQRDQTVLSASVWLQPRVAFLHTFAATGKSMWLARQGRADMNEPIGFL
ncbi:hypothetical protein KA047_02035 [Candidatus Saccharibacteria bacterium]|nr:hypothetical protein [Candidatus Saccharibacteria bacterium]